MMLSLKRWGDFVLCEQLGWSSLALLTSAGADRRSESSNEGPPPACETLHSAAITLSSCVSLSFWLKDCLNGCGLLLPTEG